MKTVLEMRHKIAERVFEECQGIFMTADYLDKVIKEHVPNAKTFHFLEGLDASRWYPADGMTSKTSMCWNMSGCKHGGVKQKKCLHS